MHLAANLAVLLIAALITVALVLMIRAQIRIVRVTKRAYSKPVVIDVVGDKRNIPARAHATDAGFDVRINEDVFLAPGQRTLVSTGIRMSIPTGYYVAAVPRSGMASKMGVTINNAPGTVDAGYQGIVFLNLINHDSKAIHLHKGDRAAQLIVQRVQPAIMRQVDALDGDTERGNAGHGSTGVE